MTFPFRVNKQEVITMKKVLALVLATVMCLTIFAACGQKTTTDETTAPAVDENDPAAAFVSDAFIDPVNGWDAYNELIAQI